MKRFTAPSPALQPVRFTFGKFSRQFSVTACGILDRITIAGITIAVFNDGTARAVVSAVAVAAAAATGGGDTLHP